MITPISGDGWLGTMDCQVKMTATPGMRPISNDCDGRDCDYRQDGKEYRYGTNGQVFRQIRYANGKVRDSVEFMFRDGHNVGTADGLLTYTWTGNALPGPASVPRFALPLGH